MSSIQRIARDMRLASNLDWKTNEVWQRVFPGVDPKVYESKGNSLIPDAVMAYTKDKSTLTNPKEDLKELEAVFRARVPLKVPRPGEPFPKLLGGEKIPNDLWKRALEIKKRYVSIGPKWVEAGRPSSGPLRQEFDKADAEYQQMMDQIYDKMSTQQGREWEAISEG